MGASIASGVGDIHDTAQDLIVRARLQKANGRTDTQVIFSSSTESFAAGFDYAATSIDVINRWLDATDACWDKAGVRIAETASDSPTDYRVTFTTAEPAWLNQILPSGVCDWTQPGVNQVAVKGTYLRLPLTN